MWTVSLVNLLNFHKKYCRKSLLFLHDVYPTRSADSRMLVLIDDCYFNSIAVSSYVAANSIALIRITFNWSHCYDERLCFHRHLSVNMEGVGFTPPPSHNISTGIMSFPRGYPHLHSIILPLVSCPFHGGAPFSDPTILCLVLCLLLGGGGRVS